jgi:hypothetical protein
LAKYPNVAVKATGQAEYAEDEYPFRSLHPHLQRCFDAFGPERMFWGTDITCMLCSWWQCVTLFTEELRWLKGRDLELVMGEALCNWIGWLLSASARKLTPLARPIRYGCEGSTCPKGPGRRSGNRSTRTPRNRVCNSRLNLGLEGGQNALPTTSSVLR